MLQTVADGVPLKRAADQIDGRLREEFGADWASGRAIIVRGLLRLRMGKRAQRAAGRLGPALTRLLPAPLWGRLDQAHRPLARYLAAGNCRREYGGDFVWTIHEEDDLLHYSLDVAGTEPGLRYCRAARMYFDGGHWNAAEVERTLHDAGCRLSEVGSFLEFACGYGRLTRHFVHRIGPSQITVSDIDRGAVDFVREALGVRGFYSATDPDEVRHDDRYDVIVVVSLFSHLPMRLWGPWLKRLGELLNPGGLLLFSTTGMHAWEVNVSDADRKAFKTLTDGFLYREQNETRGRLGTDDYGIAYVSEGYVRRVVSESFVGRLLSSRPRALSDFQDAYVLQAA